jgi:NTE family protein
VRRTGLILMGGGARAAYQAGVLDAIWQILRDDGWPDGDNPFQVICGTSAGAITAAALACRADSIDDAIGMVLETWTQVRAGDVYRVDVPGALSNALHWVLALGLGWLVRTRPRSLFDNTPLNGLLARLIDPQCLARTLESGALHAFAVTASSYTSGQHVTYYQSAAPIVPWSRTQRLACPTRIGIDHLLASSAIPFVFPAVALALGDRHEFFGDGSIRQTAPISPAIHLGADRILVIGAGQLQAGTVHSTHTDSQYHYPSLAQVAGHAMASIFLDALAADIERLSRVNNTLQLIPESDRTATRLRPIDVLAIAPSQRLDALATEHIHALPRTARTLLRMIGATDRRGAGLASYLLFEPPYTKALIELGRSDTFARRDDVRRFFASKDSTTNGP